MTESYLKALLNGERLVFQIWGTFTTDRDVTTSSLYLKGATYSDGSSMEDSDRKLAEEDGETLELMCEFELPDLPYDSDEQIWEVIRLVDKMFWKGWFYEGDR